MMKACRGVTVQLIDPQGFIVNLAGNFVLMIVRHKPDIFRCFFSVTNVVKMENDAFLAIRLLVSSFRSKENDNDLRQHNVNDPPGSFPFLIAG